MSNLISNAVLFIAALVAAACIESDRVESAPSLACIRPESLVDGALWYSNAEYSVRGWTDGGWTLALAPAPDTAAGEVIGQPRQISTERLRGAWWIFLDTIPADAGYDPDTSLAAEQAVIPYGAENFLVRWKAVRDTASATHDLVRVVASESASVKHRFPQALSLRLSCSEVELRWPGDSMRMTRRTGPHS
ncbi:MAG TPA: hypothetical protein VF128_02180 [Gemmatimonadaceae bacterium]